MMQITPGFIYLVTVLEGLKNLQKLASILFLLSALGFMAWATFEEKFPVQKVKAFFKKWAIAAGITLAVFSFIPSGKTLAAMYILPPIVNSEAVQKIPAELTDLAIEWLKELKPNKEPNHEVR